MEYIYKWFGRDLEDLTKEELIKAVISLGKDLEESQKRHMSTLDLWSSFSDHSRQII